MKKVTHKLLEDIIFMRPAVRLKHSSLADADSNTEKTRFRS